MEINAYSAFISSDKQLRESTIDFYEGVGWNIKVNFFPVHYFYCINHTIVFTIYFLSGNY